MAANVMAGKKSHLLATALAGGMTAAEAAAAVGCSERTVYRKLRDPRFARRLSGLRGVMVASAAGRLCRTMAEAADVLKELLANGDARVRLRAAARVIDAGARLAELSDLQARIERLENLDRQRQEGGRS